MNGVIKSLNERIFRLWNEYKDKYKNEDVGFCPLPTFLRDFGERKVLVVGMNPSLNQKYKLNDKGRKVEDFINYVKGDYFDLNRDLNTLFNYEDLIGKYHQYGKKISHFAELIGMNQEYVRTIDLFYFRETNQKNFLNKIYAKDKSLTNFAKEQLAITVEALQYYKPVMLIIANAKAASIARDHFKEYGLPIEEKMDESYGCYYLKLNEDEKAPLLFSSTFSGQRALDNGSFERLAWQVRFIKKRKLHM
ncbi:hypothetical protein GGR02_003446 [Anoxybacillus voinovskiensis]|uniref:Uracil-DNA glycosylase-like domain-containing protein n=1 Tax=Anoxybacteroides voinovskiense TaxID=230470 RepID=A0A840DR88_9BACL|nr:hypothetical protein [Anoxybacillus voinovskiensis]MBB4075594.1 hypothetical protein [Anoxybacillus voinovskiensis]GGJ80303.1 hypothetical protein GCM10008982_32280 [Anoxybacillus voinovskiensis]